MDLDHCVKGGVIEPWALEIVSELKGYSEISPSGEGIRILGYGKPRRDGRKKGDIEMYDGRRYLTVTGHKLDGGAVDLVDFDTALNRVHDRIWSERPEAPHKREEIPGRGPLSPTRSFSRRSDLLNRLTTSRLFLLEGRVAILRTPRPISHFVISWRSGVVVIIARWTG